jgi:hypothetical protein
MMNENVTACRLGQIRMGAATYRAQPGRRIRVGSDDDDRYRGADAPQPLQQVEPAVAGHAHIGNEAIEPARDVFRHEGLRSIESATRYIQHQKEIGKGLSDSFVIIYYRDYRRFGQTDDLRSNGQMATRDLAQLLVGS